jgi:hypothetical protein
MSWKYTLSQINLHHSQAATALLCQKFATGEIRYNTYSDIWGLWGLNKGITQYKGGHSFLLDPVYLLDPAFLLGSQFVPFHCQSSVLGMWWWWGWLTLEEGARVNLLLPQHTSPMIQTNHPFKVLSEVIDYCSRNKFQLIFGCDATAHHILWGAWTSIHKQAVWGLAQILIFLIKVNSLLS